MTMGTLYLDRRYATMACRGSTLILSRADADTQSIPLSLLDRVVVHGKVSTDTATLGKLADAGIAVSLLSGRHGRHRASLLGMPGKEVKRRLAQYDAYRDATVRLDLARCFLLRKLAGQQRLLMRAAARRPDLRFPLRKAWVRLRALRGELKAEVHDLDSLLGIEGAAAAAYFEAYAGLFPSALGFHGRKRRPPPDPVNALLSLGYTLLHNEAVKAIHAAGLDPYLGYLHAPAHGRASLASDFVEPLRPRYDALVWWAFRERVFRAHDFTRDSGGCLLSKHARERYYRLYEHHASPARRWLRLALHAFVRRLNPSKDDTHG